MKYGLFSSPNRYRERAIISLDDRGCEECYAKILEDLGGKDMRSQERQSLEDSALPGRA